MRKSIIIIGVVIIAIISLIRLLNGDNGIVVVPKYAHGVALCEGGEDEDSMIMTKGVINKEEIGRMWKSNGILYVINVGHYNDSEVGELVSLASTHCAQYNK